MSQFSILTRLRELDSDWNQVPDSIAEFSVNTIDRNNYFAELVAIVISQQLSIKAADTIELRLKELCEVQQLQPSAVVVVSEQAMHAIGLSRAKARTIQHMAQALIDGSLDLASIETLTDSEAIDYLCKIKGIGPWTAQSFLMFALNRSDLWPAADVGLLDAVHRLKKMNQRPTVNEGIAIANDWQPYRTIAARLLWNWRSNKFLDSQSHQ